MIYQNLKFKIIFFTIIYCGIFGVARNSIGATYYIDNDNGADTNNGTAKVTPWKRVPGMVGFSGTYSHQAGDQFIFKGGVTWDHTNFQMTIAYDGSAGNPDYYGVDTAWYDSNVCGDSFCRPIFNGDLTHLASGNDILHIINRNYITLDNIEIKGHMAYTAWGVGSIGHYCSTYLVMQNLFVHDWQLDLSVANDDAHGGIIGNYPNCRPTGNIIQYSIISNEEGRDAGRQNGIAVRLTDIAFSVIHDVQTAQLFGLIHDSEIYNVGYPAIGRGVVGSNQGFDETYHDNVTYIQIWDGAGGYIRPGLVYNNLIHDVTAGSGAIYLNTCPDVPFYVYNNVVYNQNWTGTIVIDQYPESSGSCGEYHIWNNTFETPASVPFATIVQSPRGAGIDILDTRNNHYINDNNGYVSLSESVITRIDSNNLGQTNAGALAQGYTPGNSYAPVLESSPTVVAGLSLYSFCSEATSLCNDTTLGNKRVSNERFNPWDIGAYEYTGTDMISPSAPSGLSVE